MNRDKLEKIILEIKEIPFLKTDAFYSDALKGIDEAFEKKPFRIAIVGEFSTGKSTFINALLGRDLLSHATEEVTATITNIHNVAKTDKRWHSCDVSYNDGKIEHIEDDSRMLEYTTTKSTITNVVDSIKSVDYYTDFMNPKDDIVIVDTPGLNGMADGHRELTLNEVKRADFCIYLVGIRGLAETDKIILREMSYYQKNFVFVINFIDQLKNSEGETVEEKIDEIKDFLDEDIFKEGSIKYEIFGVSALKGLASKDKNIKRLYQGDTEDIRDEERPKLYDESNLTVIEEYINRNINSSTIELLTIERVQHMIINLLNSTIEELEQRKERIDFLRSTDNDNKKIQMLEERLQFFIESSKKNKEKVITFAESECSSIRREFMDYLKEALEELKGKYECILTEFDEYEELEKYIKSGELDAGVKVDADKIYDYVEKNMICCLNEILDNILARIQEYLKGTQIDVNDKNINFEIKQGVKRTNKDVLAAESALSATKRMASEARERVTVATNVLGKEEREIKKIRDSYSETKNSLQSAENKKRNEISNLGSKPDVKEKTTYTTETYYEDEYRTGFFGKIANFFAGPKKVQKKRSVPHKTIDDSERKAWVREHDRIVSKYNSEIETLQSKLDANQSRISMSEKIIKKAQRDEKQAKEDLLFYEQKYEEDKKTLENLKRKANQELLVTLRNSTISQIEKYCDYTGGEIANAVKEYVEETIEINRGIIRDKASEFYENRLEQLIGTYKAEIEGKSEINNQKYANYENDINKLKEIRREMDYAG